MQNELLILESSESKIVIDRDNKLFVCHPDDEDQSTTVFEWHNGNLSIEDIEITPAMLTILNLYINQQI